MVKCRGFGVATEESKLTNRVTNIRRIFARLVPFLGKPSPNTLHGWGQALQKCVFFINKG